MSDAYFPRNKEPPPPQRSNDRKAKAVHHTLPRRPPKGPTPGSDVCALSDADVEPSARDRRVLEAANPERKMGKRKKLSARKDVQELIAGMDPASCGAPCSTAPVPKCILKLNEEYKDLFPE